MSRCAPSGHTPTHLSIRPRGSRNWSYQTQRMLALVAIFLGLVMAFGVVAYGHIAPSLNPEPIVEEQTEPAPREIIYDNEAEPEVKEVAKTEIAPVVEEASQAQTSSAVLSASSKEATASKLASQAEPNTETESTTIEGTTTTDLQVSIEEPCIQVEELPACWTQEDGDVVGADGVITKPDGTTIWPEGIVIHPNGVVHFISDDLFGKDYDEDGTPHEWGVDIIFNEETGRYEPVHWQSWGPILIEPPEWNTHPEPYVDSNGEVHEPGTPGYHPELEGLWGFVPDLIKPDGWEPGIPWPVPLDWSSVFVYLPEHPEPDSNGVGDEAPEPTFVDDWTEAGIALDDVEEGPETYNVALETEASEASETAPVDVTAPVA